MNNKSTKQETPVTGTAYPGIWIGRRSVWSSVYRTLLRLEALRPKTKEDAAVAELMLGSRRQTDFARRGDTLCRIAKRRVVAITGDKAFDLRITYWMIMLQKDAYPHQLVIDLGGDYTVNALPSASKWKGYPWYDKGLSGVWLKGEEFTGKQEFPSDRLVNVIDPMANIHNGCCHAVWLKLQRCFLNIHIFGS